MNNREHQIGSEKDNTKHNTPSIEVCFGPQCSDAGGRELALQLEQAGYASCMGDCRSQCPNAPLVLVNNQMVTKATLARVVDKINSLEDE